MHTTDIRDYIRKQLFDMQDMKYKQFHSNLLPNIPSENIIGVRVPLLRALAKSVIKRDDVDVFLNDLPHRYYDENQLHAVIISSLKDYDRCLQMTEKFLPYIDNWATCDILSVTCFKKHADELIEHIVRWLRSKHEYTVRFGIGTLLQFYLDEAFCPKYLMMVADIKRNEYYIKMMQAWFFATALAKHYSDTLPILENNVLDMQTHNKTIQKAVESYRISDERKSYLKTLRVKR